MKRHVYFFFLLLLILAPLSAQSNEILDSVLSEEKLSAESAAYILVSINQAEGLEQGQAFSSLNSRIDLAKYGIRSGADSVSLGMFAFLLQQELDLPKGLGSTIFPGPRYSLRDLKFLGIIVQKGDAASGLSGEGALRIMGRAMAEMEERS